MTATEYLISLGSLMDPHIILIYVLLGLATVKQLL